MTYALLIYVANNADAEYNISEIILYAMQLIWWSQARIEFIQCLRREIEQHSIEECTRCLRNCVGRWIGINLVLCLKFRLNERALRSWRRCKLMPAQMSIPSIIKLVELLTLLFHFSFSLPLLFLTDFFISFAVYRWRCFDLMEHKIKK